MEDCLKMRKQGEKIIQNLDIRRNRAFVTFVLCIIVLLVYNTTWTAVCTFEHDLPNDLGRALYDTFKVTYSILFATQFIVWIGAIVIYCLLKYYLYPMKMLSAVDAELDESSESTESLARKR